MRENVLIDKSVLFGVRIIKLYQYLIKTKKESIISKQIIRSGTSIGANINEANYGQSKNDFISSFSRYLSRFEIQVLDRYLDGLSYNEIAESCGKTIKSVDNAVQRIRNKLARHLNPGDFS